MRIYGYRTSKTVNGTTTDYTLEGDRVLIEKTGSDYVCFYYDAAGAPVAMATGSGPSLYIYRKNLQGDITGIYSGTTGTLLVSYVYDAWGKVTATNVAGTTESATVLARNPYLYRGYRYDSETGLYYLNSRYYDPETGRFINADGLINQGFPFGNNLFVYCGNNPVNKDDPSGYSDRNALCTYEDVRHGGLLFVKLAFVAVSAWMLLEQPVIYPAISKSKEKQVLAVAEASLAKSKTKEYRSGTEIHHLVAKVAKNARKAREILDSLDIDIDGSDNVLEIKTSLHRRLHTNLYYGIANSIVISAYQHAGYDEVAQKQAVLAALKEIRTFVENLNSNPIFW